MNYGKLIGGNLVIAPRHVAYNGMTVYNPGTDVLTALGYLPVVFTEPPTVEPGYVAVEGWTEDAGSIVQTWTVEEEPDEISEERAYRIITGEEE